MAHFYAVTAQVGRRSRASRRLYRERVLIVPPPLFAQPPTNVTHAVVGNFTSDSQLNLITWYVGLRWEDGCGG